MFNNEVSDLFFVITRSHLPDCNLTVRTHVEEVILQQIIVPRNVVSTFLAKKPKIFKQKFETFK